MTNNWFTVKVKYTRQLDDGTFKRVSEPYLLAAMSFTEAETRIYEELGTLIRGEFIVTGISRTDVHDIFNYGDTGVYYKAVIKFYSGDEEGGRMKKVSQKMLIEADSVDQADKRLKESLGGMLVDFDITNVGVSNIVDIFPFGNDGEDRVAVEAEKLIKKDIAQHMMGKKTVFTSAGSDTEDQSKDEEE